jgi:uncharacterized cupredoxin-like copper-binding protein
MLSSALAALAWTFAAVPHAPPPTITVVATDYHFAMPDTLTAGEVTLRLENKGREPHHLYLARLSNAKSGADLVAALKKGGPPPAWETDFGGPNAVDPGQTSLATSVFLEPGHYVALCIIPGPDGVPHVMKGMYADFTVRPTTHGVKLPQPAATVVSLEDYSFKTSRPISTATHRITVVNDGKVSHELALVRLMPGKHARDLAQWVEKMQGPPPAEFLGGVSPLGPGKRNDVSLALTPGRYVMVCFIPDAKTGKPHAALGMVNEFEVK